jgi:hypothetical protein
VKEILTGSANAGNSHVLVIEEAHDLNVQTLKYLKRFWEMEHGQPFREDPAVVEELKREKLVQEPAPLPWRESELQYLARALGLKNTIISWSVEEAGG